MVCSAPKTGVYRPRRPRDAPLYQLIDRYYDDFQRIYAERYQRRYGYWRPAIGEAVRRCGVFYVAEASPESAAQTDRMPEGRENRRFDRDLSID